VFVLFVRCVRLSFSVLFVEYNNLLCTKQSFALFVCCLFVIRLLFVLFRLSCLIVCFVYSCFSVFFCVFLVCTCACLFVLFCLFVC